MAGQTPTVQQLCDAAQAGDLAQVEEILAQNALLARQPITQNGQLAIQFAAREGYAEIVAALLAAAADPGAACTPTAVPPVPSPTPAPAATPRSWP